LHLTLEVPLPPCVRTTVPPCCRIIMARTSAASWSTLALSPPPAPPPPPPPPETTPAGRKEKRRARASSSGAAASLSHIVFPATAPVPRSITRPARLDILFLQQRAKSKKMKPISIQARISRCPLSSSRARSRKVSRNGQNGEGDWAGGSGGRVPSRPAGGDGTSPGCRRRRQG
jgi:hypothetical protein